MRRTLVHPAPASPHGVMAIVRSPRRGRQERHEHVDIVGVEVAVAVNELELAGDVVVHLDAAHQVLGREVGPPLTVVDPMVDPHIRLEVVRDDQVDPLSTGHGLDDPDGMVATLGRPQTSNGVGIRSSRSRAERPRRHLARRNRHSCRRSSRSNVRVTRPNTRLSASATAGTRLHPRFGRGTVVAMTTEALRTVKDRFSEYVDRVEREHERVVVTKNGRPAVVLISTEDLDSLEDTIAVLSDPDAMVGIREGDAAVARGDVVQGADAVRALRPRPRRR